MEKPVKSRSSFFSFIPKNATFSFSNPPFSPGRDRRHDNLSKQKHNPGRGFSGPIVSMIPAEARRKSKNGNFDSQEPTSPKVSCIGQIKHKKNACKSSRITPPLKEKKPSFAIRNIFKGSKKGRKSEFDTGEPSIPAAAPSLGNLKKFSSGRDAFADFDWKGRGGAVAPACRSYYSDEEIDYSDDEDEVVIPHSAPIVVGRGMASEPHKEVSLWKRRTMAPPKALQLNGKDK